jgi:clan AA aspartic protease
MIKGTVTVDLSITVRVLICGPAGQQRRVKVLIDTGYDGWLSLPSALINGLGLQYRERGWATMADGTESVFNVYDGTVVWDRRRRRITVDEAEVTALAGMALLEGYRLETEICAGGKVTIEPLGQRS